MSVDQPLQPEPDRPAIRVRDPLRDGESLFLSLVHSIPACFLRKDRDGRIVFVNQQFAALFGKNADDIVGKTVGDLYPEKFAAAAREEDERVMRTGQVLEHVFQDTVEGERKYFASRKGPVLDANGNVIGIQTIFWDITKQRVAEQALLSEREELREAKKTAEGANRAKSDFLANISHEIRTPMNAIIGITELLLDGDLSQAQREYLKMVQDSGESLMMLINDILDFSKIEAGKLELDITSFDLRETMGDTVKGLGFRAHTKGLELALQIDDSVPRMLLGDPGRIRQILVNLVGNAIKFTEQGEVLVSVTSLRRTESECRLEFTVSDTGIGIAEEHRDRIFRKFEQADTSTTRRFGGTGLGLAISSRLVHLMNGRIHVASIAGQGSQFTFELPMPIDSARQTRDASNARLAVQNDRVLVVDDNQTNLRIVSAMLGNWGLRPMACQSAADALRTMDRADREQDPVTLMICDVNMPSMDGLTLASEIVKKSLLNPASIIMLTSGTRPEEAGQFQDLGIRRHLLKPVKQSEVYDALISSLNETSSSSSSSQASAPVNGNADNPKPLRILLAEDNVVNQKLAVALLEKLGHHVTVANNGLEALARIDEQKFDLVLMDVQMPEMDGLEATRELRRREENTGNRLKVVATTAHAMKRDRERCIESGMDDYLCKPIRFQDLSDKLKELFSGLVAAIDQAELSRRFGDTDINWCEALENVGGDQQLLREVIRICLEETPVLMQNVLEAVELEDPEAVSVTTHKLKGALLFLNPPRVMDTAEQVERLAAARDLRALRPAIDQMRMRIDAVRQRLGDFLIRE